MQLRRVRARVVHKLNASILIFHANVIYIVCTRKLESFEINLTEFSSEFDSAFETHKHHILTKNNIHHAKCASE